MADTPNLAAPSTDLVADLPKTGQIPSKSVSTLSPMLNALAVVARNSPLGRGAARRRILSILEKRHSGSIETYFRGVPIRLHLDNTTERKALLSAYDKTELDFLARNLRGDAAIFVDIGANSGLYTQYLAAKLQPGGHVLAIEPNPRMRARIEANIGILRQQGFAEDVTVDIAPFAAGDADGVAFLQTNAGLGAAHLEQANTPTALEVRVRRLTEILADFGIEHIHALKIDVEGYEDRILMPFFASAPASQRPRAIVMEYAHQDGWETDVIEECFRLGYRECRRTKSNILLSL